MKVRGGVLAAVAKACCGVDEEDTSRRWREWVHVQNVGKRTLIEASDGLIAARFTVPEDSEVHGCVRRTDAKRLTDHDEVYIDTQVRGRAKVHQITSPFVLDLERDDGKGEKLPEEFPGSVTTLMDSREMRNATLLVDVKLLSRALAILRACGCGTAEFFVPSGLGPPLFIRGVDELGDEVRVAVALKTTTIEKERNGEIVSEEHPCPMFPEAEAPEGTEPAAGADTDDEDE